MNRLIRASDRFYTKHPRIAFSLMVLACAVVLYVADRQGGNSAAAWTVAAGRGST